MARDLNNLGSAWREAGYTDKGLDYFTRALAIFSDLYGPDHPGTKTVRENLDYCRLWSPR
ncbi:Tetratricopeptide TPR_1 repeat-containing protein [Candidatus Magnetobacterium bavaricum]|uniref:Tetratricopeptide TPR_1 repeat-containing protein n=1 Tax=Candidatus Magnetobacterium bavaricum TaxID=29290 RepID=A0A0F3GM32_9BACT|nr:Tetratricopeptide TPR_1 repeat-containing protein [Candidatus Magnetobacterium bavaricum]